MTDTPSKVFSWCQTHGRPDQFHNLCRRTITSAVGVTWTCSCPEHENDEETP